jgi:hypothetical protein
MGMGEKAGGLEVREAGNQTLSGGGGGHFDAGVEPGEHVGGRTERDQHRAPSVGRGVLALKTGGAGQGSAQVNIGLVFGLAPGGVQRRIVVLLPGQAGPRGHHGGP